MPRPFPSAAVATALALAAGAASADGTGTVRMIESWVVGCDQTNTCRAMGFPHGAGPRDPDVDVDPQTGTVHVERAGDPDAAPRLVFSLAGERPPPGTRLALAVGRRTLVTAAIGAGFAPRGEVDLVLERPADTLRVIAAMRTGARLRLADVSGRRRLLVDANLLGAEAALRVIDERQGREATTTALVLRGIRRPAALPPAPPPAVAPRLAGPAPSPVPDAIVAAARAHAVMRACTATGDDRAQTMRLDDATVLVVLPCHYMRAAIDWAMILVEAAPPHAARPARFPMPLADTGPANLYTREDDHLLTDPQLVPERVEIRSTTWEGRADDCGLHGVWRFDGARFAPVTVVAQPVCARLSRAPWLVLFRSDVPPQHPREREP